MQIRKVQLLQINLGRTPLQLLMPLAKVKDRKGMLPLHDLAACSTILTVNFLKLLIAAYPNSLYVQDNSGMLPLQYALINKSLSVDILMYFVEMNRRELQEKIIRVRQQQE